MDGGSPRSCQVLPKEVQSFVRSGLTVTSAAQCVEELVLNSIDAQASKIFVGINLENFNIRVEDDGIGVSKEDLAMLGTRYATSKCQSVDDLKALKHYGYRGEGLASIIEVSSYVEITSMIERFSGTYKRKFSKGFSIGSIEKRPDFKKKKSGFIIAIENLLSALPVRQNRSQKSIEAEEIKYVLQRICLINPGIVVDCRNDVTTSVILKYRGCRSFAEAFSSLFGKNFNLIEECHLYENYFFSAFVAKELNRSKNYQFVYVNKRFVGRGKVHRLLNDRFHKMLSQSGKKSGDNKYPVFLVNIKCALNLYDITLEPKKSEVEFRDLDALMKGLDGLLLSFQSTFNSLSDTSLNLLSQSFTKNDRKKKQDVSFSKRLRTKVGDSQDLDGSNVGLNVTTHDVKGAVHSRFATRNGDESGGADLNMNSPPLSSIGSSSPISEMPVKVQKRVEKNTDPIVMNLKTSRKRLIDNKSRTKVENILGQGWHPRKLTRKVRPSITKNIFKNFPQWQKKKENSLSPSSGRSSEVVPAKKAKTGKYDKIPAKYSSVNDSKPLKSTVSKTANQDPEHEESDNLKWKMKRYLRDSQEFQNKKSKSKTRTMSLGSSTVTSIPDRDQASSSLSFVESIPTPKKQPVLPKTKPVKNPKEDDLEGSFKAIKTLYLSQSPRGSENKDKLNESVEIIEVTDSVRSSYSSNAETFYVRETASMCEDLHAALNLQTSKSLDHFQKPLKRNLLAMNNTEEGRNLVKLLIRDPSKVQKTDKDRFRVKAPSVEVEYLK